MSLRAFQSSLARLATDPGYRDHVRTGGDPAPGPDLSDRERRRLRETARDPGLRVTAILIGGARLGRLLKLLPLTRRLLGDARLVQDARAFWRENPPRGAYALQEALDFCDFLLGRAGRGPFVKEVVSYERVQLELRRVRPDGEEGPVQEVFFRHDPRDVLGPLSQGRSPRLARRWYGRLRARRGAAGTVEWTRVEAASPPAHPCL